MNKTLIESDRAAILADAIDWVKAHREDFERLEKKGSMEVAYGMADAAYGNEPPRVYRRVKLSGKPGAVQKDDIVDGAAVTKLLEKSRRNPIAFDAACWLGSGLLQKKGADMPDDLRAFLASVLSGKRERPKIGGRPPTHPARDSLILMLIEHIGAKWNILPTRGDDGKHTDSACDIAGDALRQCSITPNSYSTLRTIWAKFSDATRGISLPLMNKKAATGQ